MAHFFRSIDRQLNRLYTLCGVAAALFLVLLALLVLTSIITRLIGAYIPGLNVYAGYAMAASSFLALAYTFREGGHIRVSLLRSRLSGTAKWAVEIWCLGLATVFSGFLAWYLIKMTYVSWLFEERSEGADATLLCYPQSLAAFGATVMALACLHGLIATLAAGDPDAFVKTPNRIGEE